MLGLTLFSKLDWGSYIISITKTASKKIEALICSMKFLSPEVVLYLYKSTICPCMEYCCLLFIWAGAPSCYLALLDQLQNRICRIVGPSLAASFEPLAYRQNVASLSLFYRLIPLVDVLQNWLNWFEFLFLEGGLLHLSSASDKAKLFAENFSMNSNLDDSVICLPVFPCRTNLKLHNISVTPKMVRTVIMNLDLSKPSGPDCIPVVVLKICEPELSYILAELFNKCLKESCFPDCWKVSSVVPVFKNVGERSTAKNYRPVSLLSVVSKVFERLVNNRIVDHLEKCGLFSDFQYGFRSSRSSADLLTVVSDKIARAF